MKKLLLIVMVLLGIATNVFGMDPKEQTLGQIFMACVDDIIVIRQEKEMLNKKGILESFSDYCEDCCNNFVFTIREMFENIFEGSAQDLPINSWNIDDLDNKRLEIEALVIQTPEQTKEINNIKAELARRQAIKFNDKEVLEQKVIEDLKRRHGIKSLNKKILKKAFDAACDNFWDVAWDLNEEKSAKKKLMATDIENLNRLMILAINENECKQQITEIYNNSEELKSFKLQKSQLHKEFFQNGRADPKTKQIKDQKKLIKNNLSIVFDKISKLEREEKLKTQKLEPENIMHNNIEIYILNKRLDKMKWDLRIRE
jgi:hypothetical protein